jgi:hypothetical protein
MKRILIVLLAAFTLTVVAVTGASAAPAIVIPIDTVVRAPYESITRLAEIDVPSDLVGYTCTGFATAVNQDSVHPNNDLILTSGETTAVLDDVEGSPNKVTPASGTLTLGDSITVDLLMGKDGVFSGGMAIVIDTNCTAPTTTTTTTTTTKPTPPITPPSTPTTTTTLTPAFPAIEIVKTADSDFYGDDGVGDFTIEVINRGPVDLFNVYVTDDVAVAMDPASDCPAVIGSLAVGESKTYGCSVSNLNGKSPFENEATAIGVDEVGTQVTDTDTATIYPPVEATTITSAPATTQAPATTSAPSETLPVTGVDSEQLRGSIFAGFALLLVGIVLLSGATVFGQYRKDR